MRCTASGACEKHPAQPMSNTNRPRDLSVTDKSWFPHGVELMVSAKVQNGRMGRGLASAAKKAVNSVMDRTPGANIPLVVIESAGVYSEFEAFIEAATGERGNTRTDRILALYNFARYEVAGEWHRVPGLRDFTRAYPLQNPFIPPSVREREFSGRGARFDFQPFPQDWVDLGGKVEPLNVHAEDLVSAMEASAEIGQSFTENNLHTDDYFFTKFIEWFVSLLMISETGARTAMDLGAAYPGFGRLACRLFPELEVTLLDLAFPKGGAKLADRIFQFGANAGDMDGVPDNSMDFICSHNAFEHFSGNSDIDCIQEIARVLKPGGTAVITPFMSARRHFVTLNPFACFVTESSDVLGEQARIEAEQLDCFVRYNHEIISPFARVYSAKTAFDRLVGADQRLECVIRPIRFVEDGFGPDGSWPELIFGKSLQRSVLERKHFQTLEFRKVA